MSIFGDYGDLTSLYDTVHQAASSLDENNVVLKGQHQLLMNFAYEIRHAYMGDRLQDKITFNGDKIEMHYYGFQLVWTDILIFLSVLRHNAGYIQTAKLVQANMYMLEHIVEKALTDYDPEGANAIKHCIGQRIDITNQYAFIIYQALQIKYVTSKPGKQRFRNIPHLIIDHFSEWSQGYKDLIHKFENSAREQKCEIADLEITDFPEIVW